MLKYAILTQKYFQASPYTYYSYNTNDELDVGTQSILFLYKSQNL